MSCARDLVKIELIGAKLNEVFFKENVSYDFRLFDFW